MFQRICKALKKVFGEQAITIEYETPTRLELLFFDLRTVFDRAKDQVTQNGRVVAELSKVESIQLHEAGRHSKGTPQWQVTLSVRGQPRVEVGQVTDSVDASIVCAHIASVTGQQVEVIP